LLKSERGFSLIEVTVALGLMGIIVVAFLSGLSAASMALVIADEHTTAESLARTQMEYVKNQEYDTAPTGGEGNYAKIADAEVPDGYTICSKDRADTTTENIIYGIPWDSLNNIAVDDDVGLQRIKLVIKHNGKEIITLEDYKVDR